MPRLVLTRLSILFFLILAGNALVDHPTRRQTIGTSISTLFGGYTSDVNSMSGLNYNKETSKKEDYSGRVVKEARIIVLADPDDPDNVPLTKPSLPEGVSLVAVAPSTDDMDLEELKRIQPNVIYVCHSKSKEPLAKLLVELPTIEWVHSRSAGVDFIASPTLTESSVILTNAKGMYSSTLAEYSMMACSYFAKDLPRLLRQKQDKAWQKYSVLELRGSTFGVVGYGDIGRACATLAKAYGMRVVALRRKPKLSMYDPYCDAVYESSQEGLNKLMAESDYVLIAAPLTEQTRGMINKEALNHAKKDAVIINVGRGPIIDEDSLIEALKSSKIKGAALDVTTIEPLPKENLLWELDNVLISPHCMDKTDTFQLESTEFFIQENLPRFMRGLELYNHVDKRAGY